MKMTKTIEEEFERAAQDAKKNQTEQQQIEAVDAVLATVEKAKKSGQIPPTLLRELYAALAEVRDETARVLKIGEAAKVLSRAFPKVMQTVQAEVEQIVLKRSLVFVEKKREEETASREAEITAGIKVLTFEEAKRENIIAAGNKVDGYPLYDRNFPFTREELKRFVWAILRRRLGWEPIPAYPLPPRLSF